MMGSSSSGRTPRSISSSSLRAVLPAEITVKTASGKKATVTIQVVKK